ncbi:MAG: hypothetical protein ACX939_15145, partial [Hyphococcus sp.]
MTLFGASRSPHYVREYRRLVAFLRKQTGDDKTALERAVGLDYHGPGQAQAALVLRKAPAGPFNLLDVGCGSGRLAHALKDERRIAYF